MKAAARRSCGHGRGIRVTNGAELAEAIKVALANHDGPTLIECIIDRDDCSADLISWAACGDRECPTTAPIIAVAREDSGLPDESSQYKSELDMFNCVNPALEIEPAECARRFP